MIAREVGYEGAVAWDPTKPDGMPRKCMDISSLRALGFEPTVSLETGVRKTIEEYRQLKARGAIQ